MIGGLVMPGQVFHLGELNILKTYLFNICVLNLFIVNFFLVISFGCRRLMFLSVLAALYQPLHYRLRPIESVQFRFDNLGSHFIRVQIYQIDFLLTPSILSAFKYFRYSCRGQNELFSISLSIIL